MILDKLILTIVFLSTCFANYILSHGGWLHFLSISCGLMGTIILFFYGFPSPRITSRMQESPRLLLEGTNEEAGFYKKLYGFLSRTGLFLLILSFLLQYFN